MRKIAYIFIIMGIFFIFENYSSFFANSFNVKTEKGSIAKRKALNNIKKTEPAEYRYPEFYRGIYLNIASSKNFKKLSKFVEMAKKSYINTFVMDAQSSRYKKNIVPEKNVKYVLDNGIHPIARIVVFPDGLKRYPVSQSILNDKLDIAESACRAGFKEIQFDYIRFNDSGRNRHVSLNERYKFIESFLLRARNHLKKYNVKIAADVFGRIPLNRRDIIGQRMEGLDKVVDIICPMAYPSHYTWSRKYYANPYYTVFKTSKSAKKRTKNAEIVSYIQAFRMRLSGIPYDRYILQQLKAVHDAGIKGFIYWNARQKYNIPFRVARTFYLQKTNSSKIAEEEKIIERTKNNI